MSFNPSLYIIASDLQSTFLDKDTGLPMVGGVIKFFEDADRNEPMPVYILAGTYGSYTYVNIGNEVTLGAAGNIQYMNTDVILYYYPYLGVPSDPGVVTLYYVTCENSDGVPQFTREAWPNIASASGSASIDIQNYIPNGQFTFINALQANGSTLTGVISQAITPIAPGGWTFERPANSTATDLVTFTQNDYTQNPSETPRNTFNIQTNIIGTNNSYKDICVKFMGVNTFSDPTVSFTYSFSGQSLLGNAIVTLSLKRYFGSNGSASPTDVVINQFTIGAVAQQQSYAFSFPSNSGYTIGTNNDDYLQLRLTFPTNALNNIKVTDFVIAPGNVTISDYPIQTASDTLIRSLGSNNLSVYNGMNAYLPILNGPLGLVFDTTIVGKICACVYSTPGIGELSCDGSRYKTANYSSDLIPYQRLFNALYSSTLQTPIFGTGANFATAGLNSGDNQIILTNNTAGAVTSTSLGTTTFTVTDVHVSTGASFGFKCYMVATATFYAQVTTNTVVTAATVNVGTPGPTPTTIQTGSTFLPQITQIVCPNGAGITAATAGTNYIKIYTTNTANFFYVWYTVDGVGTDPVPANGTSIKVAVLSTDTAAIVTQKTREAMNNWQVSSVSTVAASSITSGQYWRFYVTDMTTPNFYVWYKKDGTGVDPAIVGATGIKVDILTADTAPQVASKTQIAINSVYYAVPDFRGQILRGWNNSSGNDPDAATRWSMVPGVIGDIVGTFQLSQNISHAHPPLPPAIGFLGPDGATNAPGGNNQTSSLTTGFEGGSEARPINAYINYIIKY